MINSRRRADFRFSAVSWRLDVEPPWALLALLLLPPGVAAEVSSLVDESLEVAVATPESTEETEVRSRDSWSAPGPSRGSIPRWASNLARYLSMRVEKSL